MQAKLMKTNLIVGSWLYDTPLNESLVGILKCPDRNVLNNFL